ncbi:hypothetical protein ACQPXB_28175 [Amycolatopsis sp. CA-161197]|uniref:hypothetical protein n=1 Tax=Amycolatopsis sp. CA-161197 TaxID=3239922 RepID=UPI003D8DD038
MALPVLGATVVAGVAGATTVWHSSIGAGDLLGRSTANGLCDGESGLGWLIPVSLPPLDEELPVALGNHFALVPAQPPLGRPTFAERLAEVHHPIA